MERSSYDYRNPNQNGSPSSYDYRNANNQHGRTHQERERSSYHSHNANHNERTSQERASYHNRNESQNERTSQERASYDNNRTANQSESSRQTRSQQLPGNVVSPIFDGAPRLLMELQDQFQVEPELAAIILPFVLPVVDGGTLTKFMQTRQSEMYNAFQPTRFLEGSTNWLQHMAKLSVDMLPASVCDAMPNFPNVPEEISASYMTSDKKHPLADELKLLIRFTWKRVPYLLDCKDANDPLNVPYYLYWVTVQKGKSSIYGLPEVCKFIIFRILFAAIYKKGPVSFTAMSSTVSHILYLCQLGSLSACAQIAGAAFLQRQLQIAEQVESSQVIQYAKPLLQKLQDYQNLKLMEEGSAAVTL